MTRMLLFLLFAGAMATKWCDEKPDTSCIPTTTCICTGEIAKEGWIVLGSLLACFLCMCLFVCCIHGKKGKRSKTANTYEDEDEMVELKILQF